MTLFRARQWGTADWTQIHISTEAEEDEVGLEGIIASVIGSALGTSSLHVQFLNEEGEWEDME